MLSLACPDLQLREMFEELSWRRLESGTQTRTQHQKLLIVFVLPVKLLRF
jgi:hypothetical protein